MVDDTLICDPLLLLVLASRLLLYICIHSRISAYVRMKQKKKKYIYWLDQS
jgi:hypothetical protein